MNLRIFEYDKTRLSLKKNLFDIDYDYIIGTDEAGRGPAAGAVFAAAVCFKKGFKLEELLVKLNDSKKLSEKTREELFPVIKGCSFFAVAKSEVEDIEKNNILNASLDAMKRAVLKTASMLDSKKILVLVDGNRKIKELPLMQETIVKGDSTSASIAAASILAKISRDYYMVEYDKMYPEYNFKKNKGYLTKEHIEAIKKYGTTKIHRKSFLKNIL